MIINKSLNFVHLFRRSMFNLSEFQFSNVSKTVSNPSLKRNSKQNKAQEVIQIKQAQTINMAINRTMKKSKTLSFDPCKTYQKIHDWRKSHIAPVDTMGCDRLSEPTQDEQTKKYQTLIALMLSIQTTDQITSMIIRRLQQYGLTPKNISSTPQTKLLQLIFESNFNKRKAKNIIEVSKTVLEKGLPRTQQQLLNLPGIGVKIAMIYLRAAEGLQNGIGVDTHVHRISNRLGWVQTKVPNQTQINLQSLFPKKYWNDMNIDLVGFGQILCNAKKPLCAQCPVNLQCPSSKVNLQKLQW